MPDQTRKFLSETGDDFIGTFKELYQSNLTSEKDFLLRLETAGMEAKVKFCNPFEMEYLGSTFFPCYTTRGSLIFVPQPLRWLKIGTFHSLRLTDQKNRKIAATALYLWEIITRINPLVNAWVRAGIKALNTIPYNDFTILATNPTFDWFKPEVVEWFKSLQLAPDPYLFYKVRYNLNALEVQHCIDCLASLPPEAAIVTHPVLRKIWSVDMS